MGGRFLIISSGRCGSTWLASLLRTISNTECGYELVVREKEYLKAGHILIQDDVSLENQIGNLFPEAENVGTKISVPRYQWADNSFLKKVINKINDEQIKSIHLSRNYVEQFVSRERIRLTGEWHLNPNKIAWINSGETSEWEFSMKPFSVNPEEFQGFCKDAYNVDQAFVNIRAALTLDYRNIGNSLEQVVEFLGLPKKEKWNLESKTTEKIIDKPHSEYLLNLDDIRSVAEEYEDKRMKLLFSDSI